MHDLVIRGGTILDGTGAAAFAGDVAIDGAKIAQVSGVRRALRSGRSMRTAFWSLLAGLMCTRITTARRRGTRCLPPPLGMA
jgi:hypothetical protein